MFVAILEVYPSATGKTQLLGLMRRLLELINEQSGLVSVERFQSLLDQDKLMSLSFWRSREELEAWRLYLEQVVNDDEHFKGLIHHYQLRISEVLDQHHGHAAQNRKAYA
ncbi:antibiotic biosynthesis monooxygenase family protein [Ferrimonas aestuarii]|uniref:Antibiotic biosynthesis monooxygenase n=1 Tax=Ferrimonas aestuarii TaxID=2569539 RepID=A0A4U1BN92_9GAMM|nr:antibiotic biosynthesis monooxygenase [Ferrimonas aestuarii]TKB54546.1 antibiotic biosynthesis monooxygenase [Ferrimonas aestuarii]